MGPLPLIPGVQRQRLAPQRLLEEGLIRLLQGVGGLRQPRGGEDLGLQDGPQQPALPPEGRKARAQGQQQHHRAQQQRIAQGHRRQIMEVEHHRKNQRYQYIERRPPALPAGDIPTAPSWHQIPPAFSG